MTTKFDKQVHIGELNQVKLKIYFHHQNAFDHQTWEDDK